MTKKVYTGRGAPVKIGFLRVTDEVMSRRDITPAAKLVLGLLRYTLGGDRPFSPGLRAIGATLGLHPDRVTLAVTQLEDLGLLCVERSDRRRNRYTLPAGQTVQDSRTVRDAQTVQETRSGLSRNAGQGCPGSPDSDLYTKNSKKSPRRGAAAPLPDLPSSLDTPAFKKAWGEWVNYCKERGKRLVDSTIKRQISDLAVVGPNGAIASIEQSIRQGWIGLFPENNTGTGGRKHGKRQRATFNDKQGGQGLRLTGTNGG